MPTPSKPLENMSKHMTQAETDAREKAEAETLPSRQIITLAPPPYIRRDKAALAYWRDTLQRMDGMALLDDLDTDVLAIYCSMLARRDVLQTVCYEAVRLTQKPRASLNDKLDGIGQIDNVLGKLAGQERTLIVYAEKLGLTPSGRVRLARKRSLAAADETPTDDDLYGD